MDKELLIKSATNAKYKDRKDTFKFLQSITHLSLDNKKIETIQCLELCPNLTTLYLFENRIARISGLNSPSNLT